MSPKEEQLWKDVTLNIAEQFLFCSQMINNSDDRQVRSPQGMTPHTIDRSRKTGKKRKKGKTLVLATRGAHSHYNVRHVQVYREGWRLLPHCDEIQLSGDWRETHGNVQICAKAHAAYAFTKST